MGKHKSSTASSSIATFSVSKAKRHAELTKRHDKLPLSGLPFKQQVKHDTIIRTKLTPSEFKDSFPNIVFPQPKRIKAWRYQVQSIGQSIKKRCKGCLTMTNVVLECRSCHERSCLDCLTLCDEHDDAHYDKNEEYRNACKARREAMIVQHKKLFGDKEPYELRAEWSSKKALYKRLHLRSISPTTTSDAAKPVASSSSSSSSSSSVEERKALKDLGTQWSTWCREYWTKNPLPFIWSCACVQATCALHEEHEDHEDADTDNDEEEDGDPILFAAPIPMFKGDPCLPCPSEFF